MATLRVIRIAAAERANCLVYNKDMGIGRVRMMCYGNFHEYACVVWREYDYTSLIRVNLITTLKTLRNRRNRALRKWIRKRRFKIEARMAALVFIRRTYSNFCAQSTPIMDTIFEFLL